MKYLLVFLIYSALSVYVSATCPSGYTQSQVDSSCIKVSSDVAIQSQAALNCRAAGGFLVKIQNAFANSALQNIAAGQTSFWIGLKCTGSEISSCTYDDGTPLPANSYNNFLNNKPNVQTESCVYMLNTGPNTGKWFTSDCNALPMAYACQVPNQNEATCPPYYDRYNDNCYRVLPDALKFNDAETICQTDCGHITSIYSSDENAYITSLSLNATDVATFVRIGLQYQNGQYYYVGTNSESGINYTNFGYNDPFIGDCVGIALTSELIPQSQWINTACDKEMLTVCKVPFGNYPCYHPPTPTPSTFPQTCSGTSFFDGNGTIYSPGYPNGYIENICEYVISVPRGQRAKISFIEANLQSASSIQLFNDILDTTPFAVIRPGRPINSSYVSTENTMKITFAAPLNSTSNNRWQLTYGPQVVQNSSFDGNSGCNQGNLPAPGRITSPLYPNFYLGNTECNYTLTTSSDQVIALNFTTFDTEALDVVMVYDSDRRLLGRLSGQNPTNRNFVSTGNYMYVYFSSAWGTKTDSGFEATFSSYKYNSGK